jgi:RNA polymerase sigma-70 factor (ECF subfamily)
VAEATEPDAHRRLFEQMIARQPDRLPRKMRAADVDPAGAEDLAQDTLMRALQSLAGLRGPADEALLCGWVDTIAGNLIRNHWRTQSRRVRTQPFPCRAGDDDAPVGEPVDDRDPGRDVTAAASRAALDRLVAELPESLRAVFVARVVEERPGAEVALDLGVTEAAVRRRLHRARTMLRAALDDVG